MGGCSIRVVSCVYPLHAVAIQMYTLLLEAGTYTVDLYTLIQC